MNAKNLSPVTAGGRVRSACYAYRFFRTTLSRLPESSGLEHDAGAASNGPLDVYVSSCGPAWWTRRSGWSGGSGGFIKVFLRRLIILARRIRINHLSGERRKEMSLNFFISSSFPTLSIAASKKLTRKYHLSKEKPLQQDFLSRYTADGRSVLSPRGTLFCLFHISYMRHGWLDKIRTFSL